MSAADVSYGWRKLRHVTVKNRTRSREKMAYLIKMDSLLDVDFDSMAFAIDDVIVFEERKLDGEDDTNLILSFKPSKA